jgi:hypothetical protein
MVDAKEAGSRRGIQESRKEMCINAALDLSFVGLPTK